MTWLLKKTPVEMWMGIGGAALIVALWGLVVGYGHTRYADGRRSVTQGAQFDAAMLGVVRGADSTAKAHTDAIAQRLTVTRWRTDTLVQNLPDSLQVVPEVRELVRNVYTLTAQVDTLTRTLDVERAVSRLRASADSAALVSAQIVISRVTDENTELQKRPTRKAQVITGATGTVIGAVIGVILLRE